MKVILQKDIPSLGDAGEIKDVSRGYARNFLLPRKLVVVANAGSSRALEHQKKLIARKAEKRHAEMQKVAAQLQDLKTLELPVRVGARGKLFGSVTTMQIAQALADKGFAIDKRKIELTDKIRNLGNYTVKLRLAEKVTAALQLQVVQDTNFAVEEEEEYVPPSAPAPEGEAAAAGEAAETSETPAEA